MGENGLISHRGKILRSSKNPPKAELRARFLNLIELPMDIVFEVLGYLEPLDLLQLLETCRALHKLLSRVSSRVIWSRARANITGLPDCPDDLNEVGYARLAFETHCQACDQGKSYELRTIRVWAARARYCDYCFDFEFVQEKVGRKHKKSYPAELRALLPSRLGWHHHLSICRSLDKLWEGEYKKLKTDQARSQWTRSKVAQRQKINAHAALCEAWSESWVKELVQRRKRQAESRKEKIMNRLREIGWEEELRINETCRGLLFDRRVRRGCEQDLTEKDLCALVAYLNDYLEQARKLRLSLLR